MGIVLVILGGILLLGLLFALFEFLLGMIGVVVGLVILGVIIALTFLFPPIMLPLLLFGYLAHLHEKHGGWRGMRYALYRLYQTHLWIKVISWLGIGVLCVFFFPIVVPLVVFTYLYVLSKRYGGITAIHYHFQKNKTNILKVLFTILIFIGIFIFSSTLIVLLTHVFSWLQQIPDFIKAVWMTIPIPHFPALERLFSH